jgi:hypothetical protein
VKHLRRGIDPHLCMRGVAVETKNGCAVRLFGLLSGAGLKGTLLEHLCRLRQA